MHHGIAIHGAWITAVVLLSLRLAAVFTLTPLLAAGSVPATVRVLVVLGLSVGLTFGLPGPVSQLEVPAGAGPMIQAGLSELALGFTLSLGVALAFAAFTMAGEIMGLQMSFGLGQVLDPISGARTPIIGTALNQLAVVAFFLGDGHHALLRGLAFSLERFPLGKPWPLAGAIGPVLEQVLALFTLAFALAVPVMFCLLLLELALGVMARNMPQVNMVFLGIPVKIVVGLLALALWLGGMGDAMSRVYASIYRCWDAVFSVQASADRSGTDRLAATLFTPSWRTGRA
jgi:flagellar biosynthetic protein FliR